MTATATGTILVVDDDDDIRAVLAELLDYEGHGVATAANGREALDYLRAHPDTALVFLDLMMPVMDGFEFREQQKRDPAIADIPVVVMTARGAVPAGVLDVATILPKPIDLDKLLDVLAGLG